MIASDESAIRALCARWLAASAVGDHGAVLGLMTDDAVFITPGQPPIAGKAAFAALQANGPAAVHLHATQEILEIGGIGDWAWARSALTVTVTPPAPAQPIVRSGHTLTLFQRQGDGGWLLARDANTLLRDTVSGATVE